MKALLLLFFLVAHANSDRLRFHLDKLVDRNISACDDFYRHVCSQTVDPKEFFMNRVPKVFSDASAWFAAEAVRNGSIDHDLELAKAYEFKLEDNNYEKQARKRCNNTMACYVDDQQFYGKYLESLNVVPNYTKIHSQESRDESISKYIADTSKIIDEFINYENISTTLTRMAKEAIDFHATIQTRIDMIEFMMANSSFGDFYEIKNISLTMKNRMIDNIKSSEWLNSDEISIIIREKLIERVESLQVYHDFDEIDKNGTMIQQLQRDFSDLYMAERRNTGVLGLDILFGLISAFAKLKNTTNEMNIDRVMNNFALNSVFYPKEKSAMIHAPFMYRPVYRSEIIKEPIITYDVLAHELHHSLFSPAFPSLLALYGHRRECIEHHYKEACTKFNVTFCGTGQHTIVEDLCDLEGVRLAHRIFHETYSKEELSKQIYGLEITLEQAFFYYAASEHCVKDHDRDAIEMLNIHSSEPILVNAGFSLMPEFSKAFQCKKGDRMFVEDGKSCYVFGPKSHNEPPPPKY